MKHLAIIGIAVTVAIAGCGRASGPTSDDVQAAATAYIGSGKRVDLGDGATIPPPRKDLHATHCDRVEGDVWFCHMKFENYDPTRSWQLEGYDACVEVEQRGDAIEASHFKMGALKDC
jgi:hypothetical protein